MFAQLTSGLDLHANALVVRAERQRIIASNIANADTPGYAARELKFSDAMAAARGTQRLVASQSAMPVRGQTQPGHIPLTELSGGTRGLTPTLAYAIQSQPAMDNNSVDLDRERASFVDNAIRYEATLRFINNSSKTILSAIQGQ